MSKQLIVHTMGSANSTSILYQCLLDAHNKAKEKGFLGTDDASLVEWNGSKVSGG